MLSVKPMNNFGKDIRSMTIQSRITNFNQQVALAYSGKENPPQVLKYFRSIWGERPGQWAGFSPSGGGLQRYLV